MGEILARCGNRCDLCPAYTENLSKFGAQYVSDGWFKYFDFRLAPEGIECAGCQNEGKHPREQCEIKECCEGKKFENCSCCREMPCSLMKSDIKPVTEALNSHRYISKEDHELFFKPYEVEKNLKEYREGRK